MVSVWLFQVWAAVHKQVATHPFLREGKAHCFVEGPMPSLLYLEYLKSGLFAHALKATCQYLFN